MARKKVHYRTKPGKHGTLYLYSVKVKWPQDPDDPFTDSKYWAYDVEHAEDKFFDSLIDLDEAVEIISIKRVKDNSY